MTAQSIAGSPPPTPLASKLVNMFVSPTVVFDEALLAPANLMNWLVPTLLVCLASLVILGSSTSPEQNEAAVRQLLNAGSINQTQATALSTHWQSISRAAIVLGSFFGTFWSAFILWLIGRCFLKSRFGFMKALEVAGLSATILVLGSVVTGLLVSAFGDASARPALSLLFLKLTPDNPLRAAFGVLDCFHLWTVGVLAVGLSRLAGVSLKEAAFWVFGYWVIARIALIILA